MQCHSCGTVALLLVASKQSKYIHTSITVNQSVSLYNHNFFFEFYVPYRWCDQVFIFPLFIPIPDNIDEISFLFLNVNIDGFLRYCRRTKAPCQLLQLNQGMISFFP